MPNQFDSANYSTNEPAVLTAGDRIAWKRTDLGADYPPATHSLKYSARLEGAGATEIEITANESGTDYLIEVPAATSAVWVAGRYHWQLYIIRTADSERITLASGTWEVKPNRDLATTDPRSNVKIMLDAVEAAIIAVKDGTVQSYSLAGRTLTRYNLTEWIAWRDKLRFEYQQQLDKDTIARTGMNPRHIGVRFARI